MNERAGIFETRYLIPTEAKHEPSTYFFRLRIESPDTLPFPEYTNGPIRYHGDLAMTPQPGQREFILGGAPIDTEVEMQLVATSEGLIPLLQLINDATNEIIDQVQAETGQREIRLKFTPRANRKLHAYGRESK